MNFPEQLKKLRLEYDMTQKELADKINSSPSKVGMWEAGKRDPNTEDLILLCKIFDVSSDYILGKSEIRNPYREAPEQKTDEDIDLWLSKTDGYKELPEDDRLKIIEYAKFMLEKHKKPESK